MKRYKISLIPGDGIGKEVMPWSVAVLEKAASLYGFELGWNEQPWGCEYMTQTGAMMPADGIDIMRNDDAILLGAVGFPGVPDHISLWNLLLPIRRQFDQYVNMRPVKTLPGVLSPLREDLAKAIDYVIVRENTEGEYSDQGAILARGTDHETVIQHSVFTRKGIERIFRFGFDLARKRGCDLAFATKSNGIYVSMPYWDDIGEAIAAEYPDVKWSKYHIDILAAHVVQRPGDFGVVLASNLMGDILSDLGSGTVGPIGLAPSANINPEREFPSMFEPVHGSAPDIYGQGISNPIGMIWSGAMLLDHIGEHEAYAAVMKALGTVLLEGPRSRDLGGTASTNEVGSAVENALTR